MDQVDVWRGLGNEVRIFALTSSPFHEAESLSMTTIAAGARWNRYHALSQLSQLLCEWRPDLVYTRHAPYAPAVVRVARRYPLVVEMNTNDLTEIPLRSQTLHAYNRITRGRLLKRMTGAVSVTNEIRVRALKGFSGPSVVISNGIDLQSRSTMRAPANDAPRVVFLAGVRVPWHGLDKLMWLAAQRPSWTFDIVGLDALPHEEVENVSNVTYHGFLTREEYEPILEKADVAVSTLALHRKGMQEAVSLKSREYLAHGIPTILAVDDPDVSSATEGILMLPNTENNVITHLSEIDAFVDWARGRRVPREAVAHLDVRHKEQLRLEFFGEVLGPGTALSAQVEASAPW